jgi:hypothetical protein
MPLKRGGGGTRSVVVRVRIATTTFGFVAGIRSILDPRTQAETGKIITFSSGAAYHNVLLSKSHFKCRTT